MKKLVFACPWAKNIEKSWSGTHLSLYKSLETYYDIQNFDTGFTKNTNLSTIIYRTLNKFVRFFGIRLFDMEGIRYWISNQISKKKFKDISYPMLQFESFPNNGENNYIYIDLHFGFVRKLYEEFPDIFQSSNYADLSYKRIIKREAEQKKFIANSKGIFTMGKWLENELVTHYGIPNTKVHHVGGGYNIDVALIDSTSKQGNKILFVGRDFERKNGPLVVDAFKVARERRKDIELYIAGPNDLSFQHEGIHILGDLSKEQLVHYFNLCDIFCMPSKFEAYGLVFAEALTFGLPCIGRNAFEMPYFIEDNVTGHILHNETPEELGALMIDLLSNEKIKSNVINKRSWYINEYSWDNVSQRIDRIIEARTF